MRAFSFSLVLLLFASTAPPAQSQTGEPERSSAQARYRRAYDAIHRKQWSEARLLLLDLWKQSQTYDVAASLGQVEYQLQNYPAAAQYMAFAVAHVPPKESPTTVERYQRALAELREMVGTLRVWVNPPGAALTLNGHPLSLAPESELFVSPGVHTLQARLDDQRATSKKIAVLAGELHRVDLDVAASEPQRPASGSAPAQSVVAAPPPDATPPSRSLVPVFVGAGLLAVGVGTAVGFGIAADDATADASALRSRIGPSGCADGSAEPADCRAAEDALDRQHRHATLSTVGIGVAVAAGVATLGYVLFWPQPSEERATVALSPTLSGDRAGGGVVLHGSF